jgi:serine/threonine protein kinase/predicted RNA-binding Zn-ribbon protein involved in translation (DUF1610 family)
MITAPNCPDRDTWEVLLAQGPSPNVYEQLEQHIDSCPACQEFIERDAGPQDDLLQLARHVGDPTTVPEDVALSSVMERIRSSSDPFPSVEEPPDLYFLRPSDEEGVLGTLGAYEIQEVIGQGGMGVVLKAYEPALHRLVAIKVMSSAVAGSTNARRRFIREAQAAAAVCHDHVVAVHGVHEADGLPYIVMQYIAGESLQDRLERTAWLDLADLLRIGHQTAQGLAAAHAQGLIHRDIKPANLLLENGLAKVKITDFGLARTADDVGLTQNGVVAGTPEYMAPEQARGEPVDHRADLFSLGSVLYAMCTGRPPFRGAAPLAVLRQVSEQPPTPVRALNPRIPVWLEALIARLMAKNPDDRFQTAAEVAGLLEAYLAHLQQPAQVPLPRLPHTNLVPSPPPLHLGKWLGVAAMIGICLVLLGVGGSWFFAAGAAGNKEGPGILRWDFRGKAPDQTLLSFAGPDAHEHCKPEAEGLRISLPPARRDPWPVGLATTFPVKGDCDITVSYELLRAQRPTKGYGIGVTLYVLAEGPAKKAAMLGRMNLPNKSAYICDHNWVDDKGQRQLHREKTVDTHVQSGKLRLVRRGSSMSFQVADAGSNDFREIHRTDYSTDDLVLVRIATDSGNSEHPAEARLADFEIRAAGLPATTPQQDGLRLIVILGAALFILALGFLLFLFFFRRRRGSEESPASTKAAGDGAEIAAGSVTFTCPECGKRLKTRAELAGKSVKCPECGKPVGVPPPQPVAAGSSSIRSGLPGYLGLLWLPVVVIGGGLAMGTALRSTNAVDVPEAPRQEMKRFYHDFRGAKTDAQFLQLTPLDATGQITPEAAGLRIRLPRPNTPSQPTGFLTHFGVHGDCEITLSYEILQAGKPSKKYARAGVSIYGMTVSPAEDSVLFARSCRPDGETYVCQQSAVTTQTRPPTKPFDASARRGKLRLIRKGDQLTYQAAEEGGPFRLLYQVKFVPDDFVALLVAAECPDARTPVDVRLVDFEVQAENLPTEPTFAGQELPQSGSQEYGPFLLLAVSLITLLSIATWFCLRGPRSPASRGWFGWLARIPAALSLLLLALLGVLGLGWTLQLASANETTRPDQNFVLSFRGGMGSSACELVGPDAEKCVRFDSDGLHLVLPAGYPGERQDTGVATNLQVSGDFEVTLSFAILREPEPAEVGPVQTRLSLEVILARSGWEVATLSRRVAVEQGQPGVLAWRQIRSPVTLTLRQLGHGIVNPVRSGRLRLVRSGSVLACYVAEGVDGPFQLLQRYSFSADDLKDIRIAGSTGSATASLHARITDLQVRAQRLAGGERPSSGGALWLVLALAGLWAGAASWGGWLLVRQRRPAETLRPAPELAAPVRLSRPRRRFTLAAALAGVSVAGILLFAGILWVNGGASRKEAGPAGAGDSGRDLRIRTLTFLEGGKRLVTGGGDYVLPGQLQIWDVASARPLVTQPQGSGVRSLACSPDGKVLASGHWEGEIKLRDPASAEVRATLAGHQMGVNDLSFSADSALLASAGLDKTVRVWDVPAQRQRQLLLGHGGMVLGVAFFHHRPLLVSAGEDRTARIWDLTTGKEKLILRRFESAVDAVAVSPDDKLVATAGWEPAIRLFDPETGEKKIHLRQTSGNAHSLTFSPDGKLLAAATDHMIYLWDLTTQQLLRSLKQHQATAWKVAFSPDGSLLASGGDDRVAQVWDLAAARNVATLSAVALPAPGSQETTSSTFPLLTWLALLLVLALGAGAVYFYVRRRRHSPSPLVVERPTHSPIKLSEVNELIHVACTQCGKSIKARAELAGKNVKCPACGQAVRLPGASLVKSGPPA